MTHRHDAHADMNGLTDEELMKALYAALQRKEIDQFLFLLYEAQKAERNLDLSSSLSREHPTLLQCACELEEKRAINSLIQAKVDVNKTSSKNILQPLILVVKKGNAELVKLLLDNQPVTQAKTIQSTNKKTALHMVVIEIGKTTSSEKMKNFDHCLDLLLNSVHVNVDSEDECHQTPLHLAAYFGLREVIIKLLKNGADPNLRGKGGQTILHILIDKTLRKHINCEQKNRFVEAIRELLDTGSHFSMDVNAEDLQSKTPLHMAVSCGVGLQELVSLLLQKGANPNVKDKDGKTPLHQMISSLKFCSNEEDKERTLRCIDVLLNSDDHNQEPLDLEVKCSDGFTALNYAISSGVSEVVTNLLEKGADPSVKDGKGQSPLHHVLLYLSIINQYSSRKEMKDYEEYLDALLKSNLPTFHINARDYDIAEEKSFYLDCLDLLLQSSSIHIDEKDHNGNTALHLAARFGLDEAIERLLKEGANPSLTNIEDWTVLHQVAHGLCVMKNSKISGYSEKAARLVSCLRILLKWGYPARARKLSDGSSKQQKPIDINATFTKSRWTVLQFLVDDAGKSKTSEEMMYHLQCLDLLLASSKIKIDIRDKSGETALHIAAKYERGADLYLKSCDEETILHQVAQSGFFSQFEGSEKDDRSAKCLQILLDKLCISKQKERKNQHPIHEVNVNAQDKRGFTPLHTAISSESEEIVKMLLCHGALLDKTACRTILPSTLESFLDSCIRIPKREYIKKAQWTMPRNASSMTKRIMEDTSICIPDGEEVDLMRFSIMFDYSFLLTPPVKTKSPSIESRVTYKANKNYLEEKREESEVMLNIQPDSDKIIWTNEDVIHLESETLWYLSRLPKHRHLLDHPVVKSFLMLKWHSIRDLYWANVVIYTFYLFFCSFYILLFHSGWESQTATEALNVLWYFLVTFNILFFAWEVLQFCTIPHSYWRSFENWIDVTLLILTSVILFNDEIPSSVRQLSAVVILLAWTEGLILLSRHPRLSLYVTMFTTVSITFLRLFCWFSVLLIGFAFSFFLAFDPSYQKKTDQDHKISLEVPILNFNEESTEHEIENNANRNIGGTKFENIYDTFLKFFTMMKDEFDFENLPFDGVNPVTSRLIYVLFLFLVTIVLINLLNGLAITDIQEIQKQAETYNYRSQGEIFAVLEFILLGDPSDRLGRWTPIKWILSRFLPITAFKISEHNCLIQYIYKKTFIFYKYFPQKTSTFDYFGKLKYDNDQLLEQQSNSNPEEVTKQICKMRFQLADGTLRKAQQKALDNKRTDDQRGKKTVRKSTEMEKLTHRIRQLLEIEQERNAKEDSTSLKVKKLASELNDLTTRLRNYDFQLSKEVQRLQKQNDQILSTLQRQ